MAKSLLLSIFLIISGLTNYRQDSLTYIGGKVYMMATVDDKVIERMPVGTNARVTHNQFFKSYSVSYEKENGKMTKVKFVYVDDYQGNEIVEEENSKIGYLVDKDNR